MADGQAPSLRTVVIQHHRRRLIVELQREGIVLHLVDSRQFNAVTFKLNGRAHFPAWIEPAHVGTVTTHPASRLRRSYLIDQHSRLLVEIQPAVPCRQLAFTEHRVPPRTSKP